MQHRQSHFSTNAPWAIKKRKKKVLIMSCFMLNVIQFTYGAGNRLQRLEISFVIGESPVPGPSGKMWLGENKLIMHPCTPLQPHHHHHLNKRRPQKADCAGKRCKWANEGGKTGDADVPRTNKLLKQTRRDVLRNYVTPIRKNMIQLPERDASTEWRFT